MKFGKEFAFQMVPEWKEAYMGYEKLKGVVAEIQRFKQRNTQPSMTPRRKQSSLYRAFSGLISHKATSPRTPGKDIENPVILMNSIKRDDDDECESYETMFLMAAEEGGDLELVFFKRLDEEFNKVAEFYKSKVDEVMKEAAMLNKQMDAFIALRIKVKDPEIWVDNSASSSSLSATTPSGATSRSSRVVCNMDVIEDIMSSQEQSDKSSSDKDLDQAKVIHEKANNTRASRPAPLDLLECTKTNETSCLNIKGILKERELQLSREHLKRVEQQLKHAFIQYYHKLRQLKSYSFLNMLAFSKIMKKYDKNTSRNASKHYLKMVDNSYLGSSDEVNKLMDRVEATFINHFSNSNRQKGMNILRPKVKKERHRVTFSLGFFAGCTVALILALVLIIHARNILDQIRSNQYMENMFPLYSLFAFVVLHMIMYAANIYFWRRYRVNYSFIFGFKQGTELGYREVLFFSSGLAVLALASVLSNLDMEMDPKTLDYKAYTELLPLGVVVIVIVILLCPFNIIYRSSRFFLVASIFHCICAPLYKVTFPDFFLADQLTSQVQAIRSLEFYVCYYGYGDYKQRKNTCKTNDVFNTFYFIVAVIPYWSRLLQCLRRLYEERDAMQGYNGLKYLSTIVAISLRTAYSLDKGMQWKKLALVSSAIAAIYSTYWDIVVDWGLLQRHSKNLGLRDKLILPYKSVYFGAMVLNVLLRFAWLQTVLNLWVSFLHRETLIAIVASLEIIRRGMWSFFRLENEHLNNVGKFRASKSVPLPFNYDEDERQR